MLYLSFHPWLMSKCSVFVERIYFKSWPFILKAHFLSIYHGHGRITDNMQGSENLDTKDSNFKEERMNFQNYRPVAWLQSHKIFNSKILQWFLKIYKRITGSLGGSRSSWILDCVWFVLSSLCGWVTGLTDIVGVIWDHACKLCSLALNTNSSIMTATGIVMLI